jgi:hypothetical protein
MISCTSIRRTPILSRFWYLVAWRGFDETEETWEPLDSKLEDVHRVEETR